MEKELYKVSVKDFLVKGSVGEKKNLEIGKDLDLTLDEENVLKSYKGQLILVMLEDEITADFKINYLAKTVCARCLKEFDREGKLSSEREYKLGKRVAEDEELIVDKNFEIEIGESIFEEIAFDIPMKPICKESCKGIK